MKLKLYILVVLISIISPAMAERLLFDLTATGVTSMRDDIEEWGGPIPVGSTVSIHWSGVYDTESIVGGNWVRLSDDPTFPSTITITVNEVTLTLDYTPPHSNYFYTSASAGNTIIYSPIGYSSAFGPFGRYYETTFRVPTTVLPSSIPTGPMHIDYSSPELWDASVWGQDSTGPGSSRLYFTMNPLSITVSAVPEPSGLTALLSGLVLIGAAAWSRPRRPTMPGTGAGS